jgi:hypothetical protein
MSGESRYEASGEGAVSLFVSDVRRSLHIWKRDPRLPFTALALAMLQVTPFAIAAVSGESAVGLIGVVVGVVFVGFLGAERVWYVAVDRGEALSWHDVRQLTSQLWRRYFGLVIYVGIVFVLPVVVIVAATDDHSLARTVLFTVVFVALDAALTFATVRTGIR